MSFIDVYDVSVFLISENDDMVFIEEYDKSDDGDFVFIMLTNDFMNPELGDDNTIYIYKDWHDRLSRIFYYYYDRFDSLECPWQLSYDKENDFLFKNFIKLIDNIKEEKLSGYKKTQDIIRNASVKKEPDTTLESFIPAIMMAYHTTCIYNEKTYNGYLPSYEQIKAISWNAADINEWLRKLYLCDHAFFPIGSNDYLNKDWWTSTELGDDETESLHYGEGVLERKNQNCGIMPLYKIR